MGGASVDDDAYGGSVAFAPGGDFKEVSERVGHMVIRVKGTRGLK